MKRLSVMLVIVFLTGCSQQPVAPVDTGGSQSKTQNAKTPSAPVILEVAEHSVRPGGTVVLETHSLEFNLKFPEPVDVGSVQITVEPTTLQVRPNRDGADSASFRFGLELTGKQPEDASILLLAAKGLKGDPLVIEPQVYRLKFSQPAKAVAPHDRVQPNVQVWAVDPTGRKEPEVLFSRPDSLVLMGTSPDGRYWLFERVMGEAPGSPRGFSYLYDHETDQLLEGPRVEILPAAVAWSGRGFWVNWLVHLNLDLTVDDYPLLRDTLGLARQNLLAASFTPDGRRVAILAISEETKTGPRADLILANSDGTGEQRVSGAVQPWWGKAGYYSYLKLSPDGDRAILLCKVPGDALINTSRPARESWKPLFGPFVEDDSPDKQESGPPGYPVWAPDGAHVWFPGATILTRDGEVVTRLADTSPWAVWNRNGTALITGGRPGTRSLRLVTLGADVREFELPDWAVPAAFLPDERILVYRTIVPK